MAMQKTFRRSSDCSNFNDSVNHSACIERPENPVFLWSALNQWEQPRNTFVSMLSARLWWAGSLSDWGALWEEHFSPLFSPLPWTMYPSLSDLMQCESCGEACCCWWLGLYAPFSCVYVRYWTVAPSLLNKENHSPFQQCFFIELLEYSCSLSEPFFHCFSWRTLKDKLIDQFKIVEWEDKLLHVPWLTTPYIVYEWLVMAS